MAQSCKCAKYSYQSAFHFVLPFTTPCKFLLKTRHDVGFPDGSAGKKSTCSVRDLGSIPGLEDPLEKETATHSSTLA